MDDKRVISFKRLKNFVRKLRLSDNCILAIREGCALANTDTIRDIARAIETGKIAENVLVLVVDDLDNIKAFDESVMRKAGWYRIEAIAKTIHVGGEEDAHQDGS